MNRVFIIYGDGQRIGLTVAPSAQAAKAAALRTFSRFTASKDGAVCDYERVAVVSLDAQQHARASLAGILTRMLPRGEPIRTATVAEEGVQ
jgi:hypothetical protein